ncbi:type IX secretion system protein PorG [Roseivirga echinicomitans]
MKKSFLALVLLSVMFSANAQDTEVGFELGAYNYLGDVARTYDFGNSSLGAQVFVKKHLNRGFNTRISAGFGKLKGVDDEAFDVFSANRKASFKGSFFNVDFLWEYNFLDYRDERLQQFWTPYILFGVGAYKYSGESDQNGVSTSYDSGVNLRLPIGIGLKYRIDRRWTLAASTSAIKSNSDTLDNVSIDTPAIKDYRGGNPNDDDWKFFTSISISYTLYKIVCPQGKFR